MPVMAREEGKSSSPFLQEASVTVPILPAPAAGAANLPFSPSHHTSSTLQPSASLSLPGVDKTFKQGVSAFSFTSSV